MSLSPKMKEAFEKILHEAEGQPVYIAGGPVRDWLLERPVLDIDLVLPGEAVETARSFASMIGGAFVLLDTKEDVARVVLKDYSFDFSSFRKGAKSIEEDLGFRDFTINAMASLLKSLIPFIEKSPSGLLVRKTYLLETLIDPHGGRRDLTARVIRAIALKNLEEDPLRMLRAFRFRALLDFTLDQELLSFIQGHADLILRSASERINYELERIMATEHAGRSLEEMFKTGLLQAVVPEVREAEGVEQPGFHHLDVLGHCLETVSCLDRLAEDPCIKFSACDVFAKWLRKNRPLVPYLKWAGLLHDFGKPSRRGMKEDGRVTFYNHDRQGAEMAAGIARRLRWSRLESEFVQRLVRMHMRPFHLLNDLRKGGPSKRAMRKLLQEIESDYPALFLLAMADSMAGCGPLKPEGLDQELSLLFDRIHSFYKNRLLPVKKTKPLLNGRDIMTAFSIEPGPLVGKALAAVEAARIEGRLKTKEEALSWLKVHFPDELSDS